MFRGHPAGLKLELCTVITRNYINRGVGALILFCISYVDIPLTPHPRADGWIIGGLGLGGTGFPVFWERGINLGGCLDTLCTRG